MQAEDEILFARGVALFNRGEYFACHEIWEDLWKRSAGNDRTVLQGLIQSAAALLHAQRGNRAGALSLYRKAAANLETAPDDWRGIRLADFREQSARWFVAFPGGAHLQTHNIRLKLQRLTN
jgi:uncharacterized protein